MFAIFFYLYYYILMKQYNINNKAKQNNINIGNKTKLNNSNNVKQYNINISNKKKAAPLLYGLFFEDINHALDGGLNANLVQNGNFDFCAFSYGKPRVENEYNNLAFWQVGDGCEVVSSKPISENKPFSLKVNLNGSVEIANLGYEKEADGQYIFLAEEKYGCSFFYLSDADCEVFVQFLYKNGKKSEKKCIKLKKCSKYCLATANLVATKNSLARLVFSFVGKAQVYVSHFRLIANNYFKSAKNKYMFGKFNPALVNSINMGAKFLRFPGGCVVEGDVKCDYLYEWEKTIGATHTRASKPSVWGYLQSNEIGFYEYLCLCEDLHLCPLPVHHVGLICQIRTEVVGHRGYIAYDAGSSQFKEKVIDSVAHLIYFALGSVNGKDKTERLWAKKRAEMGHAKPFKLNMIALGNENWDNIYFKNFSACYNALKNYPYNGKNVDLLALFGVQILSSAGVDINPQDTNPSWQFLNKQFNNLIVDEHVYNTPTWFVDNFYRYNFYNPNFNKVFMGEYACHTDADGKGKLGGTNSFVSALCEAVFMCGMENNPDVVKLSCYAPLFCKQNQANWNPNLIYFNKNKINYTPNYACQALFMQNYGTHSLKLDTDENFDNSGAFSIEKNKNIIKNVQILNFLGKKMENFNNISNFVANINFKCVNDNFTLTFGENQKQGFKFMLHYLANERALYFEKIVNFTRMTLEKLANVCLTNNIKVSYSQHEIKVFENEKPIASKQIWKTNTNIFTSLTFDKKFAYLKAVNVGKEETVSFNLTGIVRAQNCHADFTTLIDNKTLGYKTIKRGFSITGGAFKIKLKEKSINIIKIER